MRRYNRNKNYKKKKFKNSKFYKIASKVLMVLLVFGIISAFVSLFDLSWIKPSENKAEFVDVHLVPGENWASDGSSYGAWCWNDSGVPAAAFVLATDEDGDGVHTVKVSTEYSNMLFVDLVPGATELGASWSNKREQTNNLLVPVDDNNYYHAYASTWDNNSDIMFVATVEDTPVSVRTTMGNMKLVIYCFNKINNESETVALNEPVYNGMYYSFSGNVPAGYTHMVIVAFDSEYEGEFSWEAAISQSSDLLITDSKEDNHFDYDAQIWVVPTT